jgi:aspartate racemase
VTTRIGLLGGMSWESTAVYYRLLNRSVHQRAGGHASAPVIVWSVDFAEIEELQRAGDWHRQGEILAHAAAALEAAGAEAIALATNTLHLVSEQIVSAISVPFIDLIQVAAQAASEAGYRTVGLLATGYTMESDLYPSRYAKYGLDVLVPGEQDRQLVHRVIYDELLHGVVSEESRSAYLEVIDRLASEGAQAVVLGCTEIDLLLHDTPASVPLLDTTRLHCDALTDIILTGVRP